MTAVARLRIKSTNFPVVMGDLLLSSPDYTPDNFTVPTHDQTLTFAKGPGLVASGLRQKVVVISNDLLIGWAGGAYHASLFIKDLLERNQQNPMTFRTLQLYFDEKDKFVRKYNLSFAGFFKDAYGMRAFGLNSGRSVSTDVFGEIALLGTGAESVLNHLKNVSVLLVDGNASPLTQSILTALAISGTLLSSEIQTGLSVKKLFGGGYEVATMVQGAFQKIDDITYLFWFASTEGDRIQVRFPHRSLKISYLGDILIIRVDSIHPLEDRSGMEVTSTTLHVVQPIYRSVEPEELEYIVPPSLNSTFMCNYFSFKDQNGRETVLTSAECVGDKGPSNVKFIGEEWTQKHFAIKEGYLDRVADQIRLHYAS
jgi:hypothetical protein